MGLHPEARGEIWVESEDVQAKRRTIGERIRSGLSLIPESRQEEGLIQCLSVAKNMTLASLWSYLKGGVHISRKMEESSIDATVEDLSIKVADAQLLVGSLSGGNQQKVVVGKSLLTAPKVLLMDEPTRGIDVGAKAEIFAIMSRLAAEGLGIVFVASELKEIMGVADRILVMSKGKITGEFARDRATKEALVKASAVGHGPAA
jgi:ABC-type sugar transport system ATPase subunit